MAELDLNHTKTKREIFSRSISDRIDAVVSQAERLEAINEAIASIDLTLPHEERAGRSVSASAIGDECQRRTQLNIWPTFHPNKPIPKQAPLDDKTRIVFARGHLTETLVAGWMQAAGFDLVTHPADEPAKQFGFICADGQIKGYADGIIMSFLSGGDLPVRISDRMNSIVLWENKTIADKGHRAVAKHGVLKQYPKYDVQAQMLMAYLEMPATLFSFLNAETGALHFELMPFDQHRAQAASDTAVHILIATRAGELLPKGGFSGDKFPCGWRDKETGEMTGCRFRQECWPS